MLDMADNACIGGHRSGTGGSLASPLEPCGYHPDLPFFCAYTAAQRELLAQAELRERGFSVFLPMEEIVRAHERVLVPLFRRYLFVQLDLAAAGWRRVFSTRGVEHVFCRSPERPAPVPRHEIDSVMRQCAADGVRRQAPVREMRRDDNGRITDGPLAMFEGVCNRTSRDRVWLLLTIMGRQTEVGFLRGQVEIA